MKAVVFHEFGGTQGLRIEEVPEPEPNAGQLRIKVHAVAVRYQLQHVGSLAAKRAAARLIISEQKRAFMLVNEQNGWARRDSNP